MRHYSVETDLNKIKQEVYNTRLDELLNILNLEYKKYKDYVTCIYFWNSQPKHEQN